MLIQLRSDKWSLTNPGGNYTNNGYPTRIPTTTRPDLAATSTGLQAVGDGVIPVGHNGQMGASGMALIPFGAGSATNTFSFQVLGWTQTTTQYGKAVNGLTVLQNANLELWIPVLLGTFAVTLGTGTGIAGSDIGTSQLFATSITTSYGPVYGTGAVQSSAGSIYSPGSNSIGMVTIAIMSFKFVEVIYTTGGSATSGNALYRLF
jgi:hypothetical protein